MVIGVDEVGRGSLAGPLVIGAVSLNLPLRGLKDSKLIPKDTRQILSKEVYALAEYASLGWCWPHEIDELGLTAATTLAIRRALIDLDLSLLEIVIDGQYNYLMTLNLPNVQTIIKGDSLIPSVSAASIIAKVARDNYMSVLSSCYPEYGFDSHYGYGTKDHIKQLLSLGPCVLHRQSFKPLKNYAD